jgi:hypothetical protein
MEYVISGRMQYGDMSNSDIRKAIKLSFGDVTHPIAQFMTCFTELVRDADGDTELILRKNANGDYALLVDALDQFGDGILSKSSAGKEAPLTERYPNGIWEYGLRKIGKRSLVKDKEFYFNALSAYSAFATRETYSKSAESYVFQMLFHFGDLNE